MKTLVEILEGKSIKLSQAYNRLAGMDPKQKLGFYDEYSDPKKEYTSVYMEVHEIGTNKIDTIYLNGNDTGYVISNLFPNTTYNLTFKYSYPEATTEVRTVTFDVINDTGQ